MLELSPLMVTSRMFLPVALAIAGAVALPETSQATPVDPVNTDACPVHAGKAIAPLTDPTPM